jgi:hypothetical protein
MGHGALAVIQSTKVLLGGYFVDVDNIYLPSVDFK